MKKVAMLAVVLPLAVNSVASSAEPFYISLDLIRSDIDLGSGIDDTDVSFGLGFGYAFSKYFAVDVSYQDFGEISFSGNGSASIEGDAFQLSVIGAIPFNDQFGISGQFGLDFWDGSFSFNSVPGFGSGSFSDDGTDAFFGVGAYAVISESATVQLEYQSHELGSVTDIDIDTLSLSVAFTF